MSRISNIFGEKKKKLSIYFTAGYPSPESVIPIAKQLQDSGADMLEIGIPYSDPVADGPVIQQSNLQAIRQGMTMRKLMDELKELRTHIRIPVILMGYLNPVIQYGFEKFCKEAAACGVDGLIIPDLPLAEYRLEYGAYIKSCGLDFIFLVTPETPGERIKELDRESNGFLYAVSSSSITGTDQTFEHFTAYMERIRSLSLRNPVMVGFGIHDRQSFEKATEHADGAIIGTAFIRRLAEPDINKSIQSFMKSLVP